MRNQRWIKTSFTDVRVLLLLSHFSWPENEEPISEPH